MFFHDPDDDEKAVKIINADIHAGWVALAILGTTLVAVVAAFIIIE